MSGYKPTVELRFVERDEFVNTDADGHFLPHGVVRKVTRRVLQQRYTSDYIGENDEWRDVSLVDA